MSLVRLHQVQTALGDGLNNEGSEDRKKIVLRALFTDGMEKLPTHPSQDGCDLKTFKNTRLH